MTNNKLFSGLITLYYVRLNMLIKYNCMNELYLSQTVDLYNICLLVVYVLCKCKDNRKTYMNEKGKIISMIFAI